MAALVLPRAPEVALGVLDALRDQRPLELGDRAQNGGDQVGDPVAGTVVAEVEQPQRDPALLSGARATTR
jgi:hypothetical protein